MFTRPIEPLIIVLALLSMGHVSSQCISAPYAWWYPCGSHSEDVPTSCDRAELRFRIRRETNCAASNPIVTVDFTGPIATSGYAYGTDSTSMSGNVSNDQSSFTFEIGEADLDPYYSTYGGGYYFWQLYLYLDNCETSYTWSDNFVQLSYIDDEQNTIDLSGSEDPFIHDSDCPTPSPTTPTPATPAPVTDATPAPTPAPTVDGPLALGCYGDDREDRIMDDLALSDYSMTTELCELTCLGSTYFATQYGRECWCGSADMDYALHGESTDCTYACAGDADQTCGGFDAANVYSYTDESTAISAFVGCYQDESGSRIMELALTDSSSMSMEMCEAKCRGNTYFGLQYGRECFCGGSSTDLLEHGESSACNYECPGDSDQVCGGFYAMSVYSYS
ncbi:WSC domain containing protein [Ectocarpus siliculosus]|uniref:WSC domain containing protein n=1 Tax=Ectocarpus siliculosus TaxID=2880 RepID=D7FTD7_ECTSI|nr:WSC domain containing protein [Ectocarpus siliculosus]|eukprot:CBJ48515.1 WSC domain containing protein [Ectocarpus siliculosus]